MKGENEFEVVHHPYLEQLNLFLVTIDYRTPHFHEDFELDFLLDGEAEWVEDGVAYPIGRQDLILCNPNQPHEIRAGGGATFLCMQLAPKEFRRAFPAMETLHFDERFPGRGLSQNAAGELRALFVETAHQYYRRGGGDGLVSNGLLYLLVHSLLQKVPHRFLEQPERRSIEKRAGRLGRLLAYVDQHYTHSIRLSDFARQEGLSMGYLSHFVRENLNMSFQDYVGSVRFHQAQKLLLSDRKKIIDVSAEAGFSDPRYMVKAFVANTGMTPEQYRREHVLKREQRIHLSMHSRQRFYSTAESLRLLQPHRPSSEELAALLAEVLGA